MASRNGLNPKIRGIKGAGFNRALPAPFGFGNGIAPDGNDDYLTVPNLIGKVIPNQFTVEYWCKYPNPVNDVAGVFRFYSSGGSTIMISRTDAPLTLSTSVAQQGGADQFVLPEDSRKGMIAHSVDMISGNVDYFCPNAPVASRQYSMLQSQAGKTIEKFEFYTAGAFTIGRSNACLDEFRVYKRLITQAQFDTNYNSGIGNNPFETERLLVWFKFEKIEMLDFSTLQDGTDMRLGIRDLSGSNNHAQPFNMDINLASPNYVLKPF